MDIWKYTLLAGRVRFSQRDGHRMPKLKHLDLCNVDGRMRRGCDNKVEIVGVNKAYFKGELNKRTHNTATWSEDYGFARSFLLNMLS